MWPSLLFIISFPFSKKLDRSCSPKNHRQGVPFGQHGQIPPPKTQQPLRPPRRNNSKQQERATSEDTWHRIHPVPSAPTPSPNPNPKPNAQGEHAEHPLRGLRRPHPGAARGLRGAPGAGAGSAGPHGAPGGGQWRGFLESDLRLPLQRL